MPHLPSDRARWAAFALFIAATTSFVLFGCAGSDSPTDAQVYTSPILDSLVRVYHTTRNDIRAGDLPRALPRIDSTYLGRLSVAGAALRISGRDYLRRAVWDWPILSPKQLESVSTGDRYLRLSFVTDTVVLSPGMPGQTTTFVLFRYDHGWRVAGVSNIVKPLADPYGYGYPQYVLETDLPSYMRFPRTF